MPTFIEQFASAFFGAGAALALVGVLGYLFRTAIQHWLAKTLAEYSAVIETRESNKRVVFERTDKARAEFISKLVAELTAYQVRLATGAHLASLDSDGPPSAFYFDFASEASRQLVNVLIHAASHSHLFGDDSPLANSMAEFYSEAQDALDALGAGLIACVSRPEFRNLSRVAQIAALEANHKKLLAAPTTARQRLLNVCREYSAVAP